MKAETNKDKYNAKKMFKKIVILLGLTTIILTLFGTSAAYAAGVMPDAYRPENMPFAREALGTRTGLTGVASAFVLILQIIAGGLLYFAAPIAVITIVLSALSMVVGSHETEKIEQAKKWLTWSIIGLLTVMLSYSIVRIIITVVVRAAGGN